MIHRRLLQLGRGLRGPVSACVLLGVLVTGTYVVQALLLAAGLTAVFAGDWDRLAFLLVATAVTVLLRALVIVAREVVATWAGGVVRADIRDRLVATLASLGPAYLTDARTGSARATVLDGVDGLDAYYSRYLPQLIITAVVPVVLVAVAFTIDVGAALVLAVTVALVLVVPRFKDSALLRMGRDRWNTYLDISADYLESMQGLPTLRTFGAAQRRRDGLEARSTALYRGTMAELRISLLENGVSALLIAVGTAGAVVVAALGAPDRPPGSVPGTMFLVLLLAIECFRPVRDLTKAWHAGYLGLTAVDGLAELLTARPAVLDEGTGAASWSPGQPPAIVLDDVTFTYPGAAEPALRSVSLTVPAGTTTALVGASGAGKSTLAAMVTRAHDPDTGTVGFDDVPVRSLRLAELRRVLGQVGQHPYLFTGTVAENLRLGAPDATDEELEAACRAAGVADVVADLPHGYDTTLEEGGRSLSGGQRQRLALARALVRRPAVLVLDEATSHVDAERERIIGRELRAFRRGRTCLVIAHRLSSVADVDEVVVVADGQIVQQGSPAELAGRPGPFADLLAAQEVAA